MEYNQIQKDYNIEMRSLREQQIPHEGVELLLNSTTRLEEPGKGNLEYGIDACDCPCPCPCITIIEGSIIKGTIFSTVFTGASVL